MNKTEGYGGQTWGINDALTLTIMKLSVFQCSETGIDYPPVQNRSQYMHAPSGIRGLIHAPSGAQIICTHLPSETGTNQTEHWFFSAKTTTIESGNNRIRLSQGRRHLVHWRRIQSEGRLAHSVVPKLGAVWPSNVVPKVGAV